MDGFSDLGVEAVVEYFSRDMRHAMLSDGSRVPIVTWLDDEGDETSEFTEIRMVVGGDDMRGWFCAEPDLAPRPTFH